MKPWQALYPATLRWDTPIPTTTLIALLDRALATYGPRPFIDFRGRKLSFDELGHHIHRLAATLPAAPIALLLPNTPAHPVAFFATLRAGGTVVHLSPLDPPRLLARKLQDAGARTLITTDLPSVLGPAQALEAEGAIDRLIVLPDTQCAAPPEPFPPQSWPEPNPTALLQFTGGTTGVPRAAMLTHANLTAAVHMYDLFANHTGRGFAPTDRVMCTLPLFHIYALTVILLRGLHNGIEILLRPRFEPSAILDDIEAGCTHFYGVPTMWIALLHHPGAFERDWSSLKLVNSGGAALPPEVSAEFTARTGHRISGGWGMTETSPAGTSLLPDRVQEPGEIGVPLPGIDMDVAALDDPTRTLPPGEIGELRIRGPNVMPGYWNRPDESRQAFIDGWFLTGDIGRMTPDGRFFIVDRKKDMIISGGFNVYPRAIEDAIHEHPDVREAAVIGVPDAYRGQAAKAFVSLRHGAPALTLDELRAFLSDKLGRHELPAALEVRDELPHTPVGKLSKKELLP